MPGTRKLGRPTAHRMAMLRGMVTLLLENGSIETTVTRAKEVKALTDKMITLGKKNTLASRREALSFITKEDVVKKLFDGVKVLGRGEITKKVTVQAAKISASAKEKIEAAGGKCEVV